MADKWRVIAESRKLSSSTRLKDIFISPDLTRSLSLLIKFLKIDHDDVTVYEVVYSKI